ncbi:protein YoaL [Kosakonia sp. YIM B13588]|uniref:protein YoaL n=2 Tax=Kosakonia TaxID=1330547 RepID=UPI00367A6D37
MKIRNLGFLFVKFRSAKYPHKLQIPVNLCKFQSLSDMFILRLISQEYRAAAHRMDRHRRQFTFWPSRATQPGVFRHFPTMFNVIFVHFRTLNNASLLRSLSWNS